MVLGSDRVGNKQIDNLVGAETSIAHAGEDLVDRVGRLWDGQVGSDARDVGTASHELQAGSASAVRDTDGASELDTEARQD